MKPALLERLRCPGCGGKLRVEGGNAHEDEIESGALLCQDCAGRYPIRRFVPRLVPESNYSQSWGKLWQETGHLLRDSFTGIPFHEEALHGAYSEGPGSEDGLSPFGFEWARDLSGQRVLEVGPGTGNFTEHLVKTGAEVVSVDMSDAIDTFPEALLRAPNIHVIQGDINDPIFEQETFHRIWLFQVLQHTPSPPDTLTRLRELLIDSGEIALTSYSGDRFRAWYYPLTKRLPDAFAWRAVAFLVPRLLPLKYFLLKRRIPLVSKIGLKLLEPIDPRNIYFQTLEGHADRYVHGAIWKRSKDKKLLIPYVVINTFDRITPDYTNTATHETVKRWLLDNASYSQAETWGQAGVRARAVR